MKLKSNEIDAIVAQVVKQKQDALNEQFSELKKDKALIKEAKAYANILSSVPSYIVQYNQGIPSVDTIIARLAEKAMPVRVTNGYAGELRNKIIIAQIETENLDELKAKLGIDF